MKHQLNKLNTGITFPKKSIINVPKTKVGITLTLGERSVTLFENKIVDIDNELNALLNLFLDAVIALPNQYENYTIGEIEEEICDTLELQSIYPECRINGEF